jgi:lipocalin
MIPLAKKKARRWDIDEDAEKPPCTGTYAANLLCRISEAEKGMLVEFFLADKPKKELVTYHYLSRWEYITKIDFSGKEECEKSLVNAHVTERGRCLIERHNISELQKTKRKTTIKGSAKIAIPSVTLMASMETSKED